MDESNAAELSRSRWEFASPWGLYHDTAVRPPAEQSHVGQTASRYRNEALDALNQVGPLVYACRVQDGLIKIGHSAHLVQRRKALKGTIIAVMFGTYEDEQAIHARLTGHLHHGREWYYPTPGVLAVVNEMRTALGLEPVAA